MPMVRRVYGPDVRGDIGGTPYPVRTRVVAPLDQTPIRTTVGATSSRLRHPCRRVEISHARPQENGGQYRPKEALCSAEAMNTPEVMLPERTLP